MITFIAFILTMLGCINWLMVGLLQYDFIAGLFGFQASIFSRLCYILIGAGALYLFLRVIINKGTFKVFEKKKKRNNVTAEGKQSSQTLSHNSLSTANVEASKEFAHENNSQYDENSEVFSNKDNLFDEHFKEN